MDLSGLTQWKSTIPGVLIIVGATVAMLKGLCTWDQWWQAILIILGFLSGGALMLTGGKKDGTP